MLYLIGLGLNFNTISNRGKEALKKCKEVYLENYTVDFPYKIEKLEKELKRKIVSANRNLVESSKLVERAKKKNIALLIYGSPLFATTHLSLIEECKKKKVKIEIIFNASILDAIAETGLQIYKFGKITSMPLWKKSYEPSSFLEIVEENRTIGAHSLILVDIGMEIETALEQLKKCLQRKNQKIEKMLVCSCLGTKNSKIYYKKIDQLKKEKIKKPYCFILPGKLHFIEEEFLKNFN